MYHSCLALLVGLVLAAAPLHAAFDLLGENPDARDAARGESTLALARGASASLRNPAALAFSEQPELAFSYVDHVQDINLLATTWGGLRWREYRFALHVLRLDYGDLRGYDEEANPTGSFSAGENLVMVGVARPLPDLYGGKLKLGLQSGFINSKLDDTSASGLVMHAGLNWLRDRFSFALSRRNMGLVLSEYDQASLDLPTTTEVGAAYRLKYLPFALSLAWRDVKDQDPYVLVGGGFKIAQRWDLEFGYHVGRGDERLSGVSGEGNRGLSMGIGGRLPRGFHFHWAWSSYGELGSLNRFSISWQPRQWPKN